MAPFLMEYFTHHEFGEAAATWKKTIAGSSVTAFVSVMDLASKKLKETPGWIGGLGSAMFLGSSTDNIESGLMTSMLTDAAEM
ncbi:hypothetical protein N7512_004389 [Penicillium capsulatum]|nr:hypothetical protein N7512_004389 [Penicillium capsulatum]